MGQSPVSLLKIDPMGPDVRELDVVGPIQQFKDLDHLLVGPQLNVAVLEILFTK